MTEKNNIFTSTINNIKITAEQCDYMKDGMIFCGKCNTAKSVKINLPPSHKAYKIFKDKILPSICECRKEEIKNAEKKEKINIAQNRVQILISKGVMDSSYLKYDICMDDKKNKEVTTFCEKYIKNWTEIKKAGVGALFFGDIGTGKTFHACCIANELLKIGEEICITNFMRILNKYKDFEENLSQTIDMICNSKLLVLDDFGAERSTEFANEKIFEVIDFRHRKTLPTIVTTNLSLDELENGNLTSRRIFSRINEMCPLKLPLLGEDRRKESVDESVKKVLNLLD